MSLTSTTKNPAIWINRRCAVVKPVGSDARRLFGCNETATVGGDSLAAATPDI